MSVAAQDADRSGTPSRSAENKAPLLQGAGSVPVPDGTGTPEQGRDSPSLGHGLNTAHVKKSDIPRGESPGLGTKPDATPSQPPNWMNQDDILDAASKGQAADGTTTAKTGAQVEREQGVDMNAGGKMSGPTGEPVGKRDDSTNDTYGSVAEQEKEASARKQGLPSKDGEGTAGLPFDEGVN